jgi:hypothetical protein
MPSAVLVKVELAVLQVFRVGESFAKRGGRVLDYGEDMNARDIQRLMFVGDM